MPQNKHSEIKKYLAAKRAEREEIQKQIMDLNEQRRKYIEENTKETSNGLEDAMVQAIKKQAEKKNYTWN